MLKIKNVELIEINLPMVHFFETSFGRTYERRIILVRVEDAEGGEGWGEVTCGESPGYSDEWTDSAWVTAEKILAPLVVGNEVESAADVWSPALAASRRRQSNHRMWRVDRYSRLGCPAFRKDPSRSRRGLQTHQDQDQSALGL